jgi:hypothetical protein
MQQNAGYGQGTASVQQRAQQEAQAAMLAAMQAPQTTGGSARQVTAAIELANHLLVSNVQRMNLILERITGPVPAEVSNKPPLGESVCSIVEHQLMMAHELTAQIARLEEFV